MSEDNITVYVLVKKLKKLLAIYIPVYVRMLNPLLTRIMISVLIKPGNYRNVKIWLAL